MKNQSHPFDKENFNPIVTLGLFFTPSKTFDEMTNAEKNTHIAKSNAEKMKGFVPSNNPYLFDTILATYPDGRKLIMSGNHLETK